MKPGIEHTSLYSYFNARMPAIDVLSELVDNALDAGAKNIEITITTKMLQVCDDGAGIENMENMLRIGKTGNHSNPTAIGQFGVGGKHALLSVGSVFELATCSGDRFVEVRADFKKFAKSGFHELPDPIPVPASRLSAANRIALEDTDWNSRVAVTNRHNRKFQQKGFLKKLAIRYRPALKREVSIVVVLPDNAYDLSKQEYADPTITDIREDVLTVNGKAVSVRAGITKTAVSGMTGRVLVGYGPRVIEAPSDIGDHNIPMQIYVEVSLAERDWRRSLATHKDMVMEDREELLEAVWSVVAPLCEEVEKMQKELRFELVCEGLGERMKETFRELLKKGKRRVTEQKGGSVSVVVPPTETSTPPNPHPNPNPEKHEGEVEEGEHEVEELREPGESHVHFDVRANPNLDKLYKVKSTLNLTDSKLSIVIELNTSYAAVQRAFDDSGDAALLMVAHVLGEHFSSSANEITARVLFAEAQFDESDDFEQRCAMVTGGIIESLKAMPPIREHEVLI